MYNLIKHLPQTGINSVGNMNFLLFVENIFLLFMSEHRHIFSFERVFEERVRHLVMLMSILIASSLTYNSRNWLCMSTSFLLFSFKDFRVGNMKSLVVPNQVNQSYVENKYLTLK